VSYMCPQQLTPQPHAHAADAAADPPQPPVYTGQSGNQRCNTAHFVCIYRAYLFNTSSLLLRTWTFRSRQPNPRGALDSDEPSPSRDLPTPYPSEAHGSKKVGPTASTNAVGKSMLPNGVTKKASGVTPMSL
jgi:hypothetical protein